MSDPAQVQPRLYTDLAELWPLVSGPQNYVEEVTTFRRRFARHGVAVGASVLHLGCGGGSIDHNLKQHYKVTGVDLNDAMLANARALNPDVEYVQGDMRNVRLQRTFDAVLVHDAISYMTTTEELAAAYATAAAHLRPGGIMVALPEELRSRLYQHRTEVDTDSDGERTLTMMEVDFDPDPSDHSYETCYVFLVREGENVRVELDRHVHGVFTLEEFLAAIHAAGFTTTVESWELSDWPPDIEPLPLITCVRT